MPFDRHTTKINNQGTGPPAIGGNSSYGFNILIGSSSPISILSPDDSKGSGAFPRAGS